MARDLVSGGLFFISFAAVAYVLASFLPLWWYSTTELEGEMCACGTGLWQANYTWGDDLTQPNILHGPIVCDAKTPTMTQRCDAELEGQPETRAKGYIAGVFSIISIVCAVLSFGCAISVLMERRNVLRFRRGVMWATFMSLVSIFSEVICIGVFMSSPLFSDLSYNFSCHFVFEHALNSNSLKCHALGPAFGLAVGGCLLSTFACIMFYLAFKNPQYMDPTTGRYSMFEEALLGARPLDPEVVDTLEEDDPDLTGGQGLDSSGNGDDGNGFVPLLTAAQRFDSEGLSREGLESRSLESLVRDRDGEVRVGKVPGSKLCGGPRERWSLMHSLRLYAIPTLLIFNAALFTWSNCSTGATVEPNVSITFPSALHWIAHEAFPNQVSKAGKIEFKDDVFNFTILTSLRHFWEGKAYGLAVLIGVFSGIWPYVKIFTMLALWFVPATEKLRGKLLHWLDVLGKWSLVDAYVLCLMSVAFRFNTDKDILGILIHVDMSVRPGWGVYSFVIATMWSLCMSHYMTHLHRNAMERREYSKALLDAMERPPHETLANRPYAPFPRRRRFACSQYGQFMAWLVLVVTVAITLTGQLIRTFEFRFSGLADLILPPEKRNTTYSLVMNGILIPEAASGGGFLSGGDWAWFMTVMYFLFAMVIPLAMMVGLAVLWGVPMTLATTKRAFHFCQILQAWAALDVFIVSIVAAVIEIGQLSEAILQNAFSTQQDALCSMLTKIPPKLLDPILHAIGLPSIDGEIDNCALFRVEAGLLEGTWMLLYSVCAWGISTHLIMEFCESSIEERTCVLRALTPEECGDAESEEDPYVLLRSNLTPFARAGSFDEGEGQDTEGQGQGSSRLGNRHDTVQSTSSALPDNHPMVTSPYLKRILQAQERGASRFQGTYFGNCMYGPFPRNWWTILESVGVLKRVPWDKVGFDIHAALLMNALAERGIGGGARATSEMRAPRDGASSSTTSTDDSDAAAREGDLAGFRDARDWEPLSPANT